METAFDIIARSISIHPSSFAEACEKEAATDRAYAASHPGMPSQALEGCTKRAAALLNAAKAAREFDAIDAASDIVNFGGWIAPHNIACRLLCLPAHTRTQSAIALQESLDSL